MTVQTSVSVLLVASSSEGGSRKESLASSALSLTQARNFNQNAGPEEEGNEHPGEQAERELGQTGADEEGVSARSSSHRKHFPLSTNEDGTPKHSTTEVMQAVAQAPFENEIVKSDEGIPTPPTTQAMTSEMVSRNERKSDAAAPAHDSQFADNAEGSSRNSSKEVMRSVAEIPYESEVVTDSTKSVNFAAKPVRSRVRPNCPTWPNELRSADRLKFNCTLLIDGIGRSPLPYSASTIASPIHGFNCTFQIGRFG